MLKIIKHCEEEGSNGDLVQGVLLGLIQDNRLEITNCFPFPSSKAGEDEDDDEGNITGTPIIEGDLWVRGCRASVVTNNVLKVTTGGVYYRGGFMGKGVQCFYCNQQCIEGNIGGVY